MQERVGVNNWTLFSKDLLVFPPSSNNPQGQNRPLEFGNNRTQASASKLMLRINEY